MKVGVIGLGLIGASLAKAIKERGEDHVAGFDIQPWVVKKAKLLSAIDSELAMDDIGSCDMLLLAVYPAEAIRFLRNYADFDALSRRKINAVQVLGRSQVLSAKKVSRLPL